MALTGHDQPKYAVTIAEIRSEAKRQRRQADAAPVMRRLFEWVDENIQAQAFLPSNPFLKALGYIQERKDGLMVYLDDPDVPIDTNHVERVIRAIPMGRKNGTFCWTELGAQQIAIVQSLLATCRLHDVNPYDYLVDVLQRVGEHPQARVHELTPRVWKTLFADKPMRSDLHHAHGGIKDAG
ncbi:transposase [Dyella sp. M7H15-1]|nr:transposase [Dyella sp. M7H15-1]